MKKLQFHYRMELIFDREVTDHRFTLKCVPKDGDYQAISKLNVEVYPKQFISQGHDSFGNITLAGYAPLAHDRFFVNVSGEASTGKAQHFEVENKYKMGFYKYHTPITRPGACLKEYFSKFSLEQYQTNMQKAIAMMGKLHADFPYVKGITSVSTTAEQALQIGGGVCQDYSHILISLLRMAQIPARYVVGILEGEGFSHAWVEVFEEITEEEGVWLAIDPTNNLVVEDLHIKFSCGKDYHDCNINQGIFTGGGNQTQNVSVIVAMDQDSLAQQ